MNAEIPDVIPSPILRPLSPGKLYHVFFSHSSEDADWVLKAVEKLESPQYGYKCCYADRDFGAGIPVLQNITKCIHSSKRTVLVLSPDFMRSNWCKYEAQITEQLHIDTSRRILIPVLLRECNIPNFIKRLSYICVSKEHFWDRLIEAIDRPELEESLPRNQDRNLVLNSDPYRDNGQFLLEKIVNEPCRINPNVESDYIPEELTRNVEITQEEYDDVMKILLKDNYLRYHGFFILKFWILFLAAIGCFIPTIILYFTVKNIYYMIISLVLFIIIFQIIGLLIRVRSAKRRTLKKMNRILFEKNLLVGLCNNNGCTACCLKQLKIKFFYYDWRPCQRYLMNILSSFEPNSRPTINQVSRNHRLIESTDRTPLLEDNRPTNNHANEAIYPRLDCSINSLEQDQMPSGLSSNRAEAQPSIAAVASVVDEGYASNFTSNNTIATHSITSEALPIQQIADNSPRISIQQSRSYDSLRIISNASPNNQIDVVSALQITCETGSSFCCDISCRNTISEAYQWAIRYGRSDTKDIEKISKEVLLYFSMEYGDLLASRKLKKPEAQRHTNQGECLCQFAESFLDGTPVNSFRFSCIFGGPSRRPWRRLFIKDT